MFFPNCIDFHGGKSLKFSIQFHKWKMVIKTCIVNWSHFFWEESKKTLKSLYLPKYVKSFIVEKLFFLITILKGRFIFIWKNIRRDILRYALFIWHFFQILFYVVTPFYLVLWNIYLGNWVSLFIFETFSSENTVIWIFVSRWNKF